MLLESDIIIITSEDQELQSRECIVRHDNHYKVGHNSRHISMICVFHYNMYDFLYSMQWMMIYQGCYCEWIMERQKALKII